MTKLAPVTVGAMVTIDVHVLDVCADLTAKNVDSADDFERRSSTPNWGVKFQL